MLRNLVARNVRAMRLMRGMSQLDLAKKSGLTVRYISRLENEPQNLTLEVIEKLAESLGCQMIEFLVEDATPKKARKPAKQNDLENQKEMLEKTIHFLQSLKSRL